MGGGERGRGMERGMRVRNEGRSIEEEGRRSGREKKEREENRRDDSEETVNVVGLRR